LRQLRAVSVDYSWSWDPGILLLLAVATGVYVRRWRQARASDGPRGASGWRLASFLGGIAMIFIALISPVDVLGSQIFAMHMAQHLLLADLASILIILGFTKVILRPATRRLQQVERAAGPFAHPAFGAIAYVTVMFVWHIPALYDSALRHSGVHALEHICFAAAGFLYWWHLISPIRSRMRLAGLGPVFYMVSTKIAVGLLGIVITFAPEVLYDFYDQPGRVWGMTPLEDQGVAGMVMALEQSFVMGIALVSIFIRMLIESEREQQRIERYGAV
jgi:cytochrome c oxidase assembly factor CtaG